MPRKAGGTGVGRGNGAGSRRGQFKTGQPSGNPKGRPRKQRLAPTDTMKEAITRLLTQNVTVTVGNDNQKMRRIDALAEKMMEQLGHAPLRDMLAFFRAYGGFETNITPPYVMPERTAELLVQELAQEAIRCGYLDALPSPDT